MSKIFQDIKYHISMARSRALDSKKGDIEQEDFYKNIAFQELKETMRLAKIEATILYNQNQDILANNLMKFVSLNIKEVQDILFNKDRVEPLGKTVEEPVNFIQYRTKLAEQVLLMAEKDKQYAALPIRITGMQDMESVTELMKSCSLERLL